MMRSMSQPDEETARLLRDYRAVLLRMDQQRIQDGGEPRVWNQLVNRMQAIHLRLRATVAGRAGITGLVSDDNKMVRQWSATNALAWDEPIARAELERLGAGTGLSSLDARMTLREYDAGRLKTDWTPKRS
jgi:hypothetical protein